DQRRPFWIAALRPVQGTDLVRQQCLIGAGSGYRRSVGEFERAGIEGARTIGIAVGRTNAFNDKVGFENWIVRWVKAQSPRVHARIDRQRIRLETEIVVGRVRLFVSAVHISKQIARKLTARQRSDPWAFISNRREVARIRRIEHLRRDLPLRISAHKIIEQLDAGGLRCVRAFAYYAESSARSA